MLTVTAKAGAKHTAKRHTQVIAKGGSRAVLGSGAYGTMLAGCELFAENGSLVFGEAESRLKGFNGSCIIAKAGSIVLVHLGSKTIARVGPNIAPERPV